MGSLSRRSLLAAGLIPALTPKLVNAADAPGVIVAPFAMPRNEPYMLVGIDGQGPFRFLLDTGDAAGAAISEQLAQKLKLTDAAGMTVAGIVGKGDETVYVAEDLNIAGVMRQRHVALNGMSIFHGGRAGALDGVLPAHLFMSRDCDIDFAKKEVRVYMSGGPDRMGFTALPYGAVEQFKIGLRTQIDDKPARMVVDTGAGGMIWLGPAYVRRHGLWNAFPKFIDTWFNGVTGGAKGRLVKMPSATFGPYRFHDIVVELADPDAESEADGTDGLIGIDILRRFTLSIAAADHALWIKPNEALGDPFRYHRAGLKIDFEKGRGTFIASVTPGGPADKAGLRPGERLSEIKNAAYRDAFLWSLSSPPGTTVNVQVERGGAPQIVPMVLEDLL
jgi:predicted aspartyl protease